MELWCTTCHTDWKSRPTHRLDFVAASDDRAWLIEQMNVDVAKWQTIDIKNHNENLEEGEPPTTEWPIELERWEMKRSEGQDLREFVWAFEGDRTTIAYHILDR